MRRFRERVVFVDRVGGQEAAGTRSTGGAKLVHPLGHRGTLVLQRNRSIGPSGWCSSM